MSKIDASSDSYAPLKDWRDLPQSGDMAVFNLGGQLVGFTPVIENGEIAGWGVTTGNPDYRGLLVKTDNSMSTDRGQEITYDYSFQSQNPYQNMSPQFVTVHEFKQIFFGDYSAETPEN